MQDELGKISFELVYNILGSDIHINRKNRIDGHAQKGVLQWLIHIKR